MADLNFTASKAAHSATASLQETWINVLHGSFVKAPALITVTLLLGVSLLLYISGWKKRSKYPLVNPAAWWQLEVAQQFQWIENGINLMNESRKKFRGKPYRALTEVGETIILPPELANSVKAASSTASLNFRAAAIELFHPYLPAFKPFDMAQSKSEILQKVVRKQLTQHLNGVTAPLSSECTHAIGLRLGNSSEWSETPAKELVLDIVARISSRVFLGEELCRNEEWLKITKAYTINSFSAAFKLSVVPLIVRPLLCFIDPDYRSANKAVTDARRLVGDLVSRRREMIAAAQVGGYEKPQFDDAISWAESECGGETYDAACFQLMLSFAAIHTTTNLLSQTLLLLSERPELVEPLRQEMIAVLQVNGWKKTALYNMRLLDSAIKEAQRTIPPNMASLRRLAIKDVQLTEDILIRKGERTILDSYSMIDPEIHSNPETYDIYRFHRIRQQPGNDNKFQLVATSAEHPAFGHGPFACPGRFFAANEIKIALCHLLLKYDWKLAPGTTVKPLKRGTAQGPSPTAKIMFRRRKEEIDLETLDC
ncbi:cytochrome p450 monooxygenase [Paramyrothecium foliicola]|nr:cytochrome p450 monooxygenase [Paramyrothecium foliicola]